MLDTPLVSIIIPTRNRPEELVVCLQRLRAAAEDAADSNWECLVVNDARTGSIHAGVELANSSPHIRHLDGPGRGPAANRNAGAARAAGRWLIFLDDDCVPDPGFVKGYLDYIQAHPEARALEGCTYPDRPAQSLAERGPFNEKGGCFYSCNIALRRDLFEEVGGFDEDYAFSLEDMDLYTRLLKKGEPLAFVPDASVMHPQKEGVGWGFFWSMQKGRRTYSQKHPDQARSYSCEQMWKIWLSGFFKGFLPDVVRFRGRGLAPRLVYELLSLWAPLLLGAERLMKRPNRVEAIPEPTQD